MTWTREALVSYLYGFFARVVERNGVQVAAAEEVRILRSDVKTPSGLFRS